MQPTIPNAAIMDFPSSSVPASSDAQASLPMVRTSQRTKHTANSGALASGSRDGRYTTWSRSLGFSAVSVALP
jgi:hypothetical protein